MVNDKETNTVYFSRKILEEDSYNHAFRRIQKVLDKHQVSYRFLDHTRDIWCQDYMPIQVAQDRFIQFRYEPSYLVGYESLQSDPKIVLERNGFKAAFSTINLDGGNVVKHNHKAILTRRVFKDNPELERQEVLKHLENLLESEIHIIPDVNTDLTGHADGHVRFIDENRVLVNQLDGEYKYWRDGFLNMVDKAGFEYVEMPLFISSNNKHPHSAVGCYLNYLEVGNLIVFPIFEVDGNLDKEALEVIKNVFPERIVEPVMINEIGVHGGLMNCCTWNIKL